MQFTPDVFNGLFEFVGGCFLCLNVKNLYRDKKLQGVSWLPTVFMSSWGVWNLYYYPSLNQWWSFWGGLWIVSINTTWLGMILYYYLQRKKHGSLTPERKFRKDVENAGLLMTKNMTDKEWAEIVKKIRRHQFTTHNPTFQPRGGLIRGRFRGARGKVLK